MTIDVEKYKKRIDKAKAALNELPVETFGWKAQKQLNKKREDLLSEIRHLENLIRIAKPKFSDGD